MDINTVDTAVVMQLPLINPKVSGVGVVIKKDGTVSKPEQPKEKQDGRNPGNRSA